MDLDFRILGPLEVWRDGIQIPFTAAKQRAVLALLLLEPGRLVPSDRLIEELWEGEPPRTARGTLQTVVLRVRRRLGDTVSLLGGASGYALQVTDAQIDAHRFEALAERARGEAEPAVAAARLREALELWRGPPLADVPPTPRVVAETARLEERRLAVLEERIEIDLAIGRHRDLVGELAALVARYPLRERLWGALMLALHRSGRRGDALAAFLRARAALAEELGLEPDTVLRTLHDQILRDDPLLALVTKPDPVPHQMPPVVGDFTGREDLIGRLTTVLCEHDTSAPALLSLCGPAGVGKTTLAICVGHRVSAVYPDGQLFVRLAGASANPRDPADVLGQLLRTLGLHGAAIPDDVDERAALFRSRVATRRILLILDDAAGAAQVRSLLPGRPGCAVLITSRSRMASLEGCARSDVGVLTRAEAVELVGRIAGRDRVSTEPSAAAEIVAACGYLPLAVRIAAARLAVRPGWRLADLSRRLADERRRLDELRIDDLAVRPTLALSHAGLDPGSRQALRLLGLLGARDLAGWVVPVLLDRADGELATLLDANVVDVVGMDEAGQLRYRLHDLVRADAHERALAEDSDEVRRKALARLFGVWLTLLDTASAVIHPPDAPPWLKRDAPRWLPPAAVTKSVLADPMAWYLAERANLTAAIELAHHVALGPVVLELATGLVPFFLLRSDWDDWRDALDVALTVARQTGDDHAVAVLERSLGDLHENQGRYGDALKFYEQCLPALQRVGDRCATSYARMGAGACLRGLARLDEASSVARRCVDDFDLAGDLHGKTRALCLLGQVYRDQGQNESAVQVFELALAMVRDLGEPLNEAQLLQGLGRMYLRNRLYDDGVECLEMALRLVQDPSLDHRPSQAYILSALARGQAAIGRPDQAVTGLDEALGLLDKLGDQGGFADAQRHLGYVYHLQGRHQEALDLLLRSQQKLHELNRPFVEAQALRDLGEVHEALGDHQAAASARSKSRAIFRRIGAPDTSYQGTRPHLRPHAPT